MALQQPVSPADLDESVRRRNPDILTFAELQPGVQFILYPVEYTGEPSFGGRGYFVLEKLDSQLAVRLTTDTEHRMEPDTKVLTVYA